jgi:predicted nucleic acid-binding protein
VSKVLVDTDILIEVLKGRNGEIIRRWNGLIDREIPILYSPVTAAELFHGLRDEEKVVVVEQLANMECAPLDCEVGRRAGGYLQAYRASHSLALGDAFIAATASAQQLRLWTRSRKHFPMPDIRFL